MNTPSHAQSHAQHGGGHSDADPRHAQFVPLHDAPLEHIIYGPSLVTFALIGALSGGILVGWLAYAVAEGSLPVEGLGQFAAAGWGVATFTGAGVGVALGGLAGGLVALFRLPSAKTAGHSGARHH